jgi:hypothetical protein
MSEYSLCMVLKVAVQNVLIVSCEGEITHAERDLWRSHSL